MITSLLWGTTWSPTNMVRARQESLTTKRAAPHTPRIHDEDDALDPGWAASEDAMVVAMETQ